MFPGNYFVPIGVTKFTFVSNSLEITVKYKLCSCILFIIEGMFQVKYKIYGEHQSS